MGSDDDAEPLEYGGGPTELESDDDSTTATWSATAVRGTAA